MNIPQNYFKKDLNDGVTNQATDSFQLSSNDPIVQARQNIEAQPEQMFKDTSEILARFLEDETDVKSLNQAKQAMREIVLSQFPVFALNEDYIRALAMIIMEKFESAQILVEQLSSQVFRHAIPVPQQQPSPELEESGTSYGSQANRKYKLTDAER